MSLSPAMRTLVCMTQRVDSELAEASGIHGKRGLYRDALSEPDLWLTGEPRLRAVLRAGHALGLPAVDVPQSGPELDAAVTVASLGGRVEVMLATGGDDRMTIFNGTNSYGMPLYDLDPTLRGSSCTATPPDAEAISVARSWRDQVMDELTAGGGIPNFGKLRERVADRIVTRLGLEPDASDRVLLSPSGTDSESVLSSLTLGSSSAALMVITVGAREAGSGTTKATAGKAFRVTSPYAVGLRVGQTLAGFDERRISQIDVELRDGIGRARRPSDVEAEVEAHIEASVERGCRVIVHAMGGAKTGLTQLTQEWIKAWRRYSPELRVVLDAAQLRLTPEQMRSYADAGSALILTGSKALCAPPFCGAVLLDDRFAEDAAQCDELPKGLQNSVSIHDLPTSMSRMVQGFHNVNLPLLARWEVALHEWDHLSELGEEAALISHSLVTGWRTGLERLEGIEVLPMQPDSVESIVSVIVRQGQSALTKASMNEIYQSITQVPGVYIGQPVELYPGGMAVLRLAVGAATINRIADEAHRTGSLTRAVDRVIDVALDRFNEAIPVRITP